MRKAGLVAVLQHLGKCLMPFFRGAGVTKIAFPVFDVAFPVLTDSVFCAYSFSFETDLVCSGPGDRIHRCALPAVRSLHATEWLSLPCMQKRKLRHIYNQRLNLEERKIYAIYVCIYIYILYRALLIPRRVGA